LFSYREEFSIYQPFDTLVRLPLSLSSSIHPISFIDIPLRFYWSDFICYSMSSELETLAVVTNEVASDVAVTATLSDNNNDNDDGGNGGKDPFADYTIRFAQYNFYMRPPGINSNGNDYKSERLRYFIEHELDRFDVIAFQELFGFGSNRRATLLKAADAKGFKYSVSSPRQCAAALRIDGGVVIISRFPIIRHASLTFDRGIDSDWLAAKGVIYAKLRVAGKQYLHLFSTHLQSSYTLNYPMSDQAVQIRLKQLYAARRFIDVQLQDEPSDSLIVFAGDLNVNGRADDSSAADKGACSDEYQAALNILKGVGIHPSLVPGARYDSNVYVSEDKYLVQDLLYEHLQVHPETFGDVKRDANNQVELDARGQPIPVETTLTVRSALCWRQRLDYILVLRRGEDPHSVAPNVTDPKSTVVEKFLVNKKYQDSMPTTQLSGECSVVIS
jgi:endonuclease/exonuclease/phosphatase family metal-dependent hydrolase